MEETKARAVEIPEEVASQLILGAMQHAPREACGLLLGSRSSAFAPWNCSEVESARPVTNTAPERNRYALDPVEYAREQASARGSGLEVIGVYHSHVGAPARPSGEDSRAALALWGQETSWLYLIVSTGSVELLRFRGWRLIRGRWSEQAVITADAASTKRALGASQHSS